MTVLQKLITVTITIILLSLNTSLRAADWPVYGKDNHRSFVTEENLMFPLHEQWQRVSAHRPSPAWPAPANQDFWHRIRKLVPAMTFDRAFHVGYV